jgi:hypothetical protein
MAGRLVAQRWIDLSQEAPAVRDAIVDNPFVTGRAGGL